MTNLKNMIDALRCVAELNSSFIEPDNKEYLRGQLELVRDFFDSGLDYGEHGELVNLLYRSICITNVNEGK